MQGTLTLLTSPPGAEDKARKGAKSGAVDGPKSFAYDKSYWSFDKNDSHYAGQKDLFQDLGVPLLDNAFEGYNNCIFAYGQTGSGKSYSMMGYGEDAGVIPMICKDMFARIASMQAADPHLVCTVEVSYLEIYNEKVRDLLNPATKGNLKVREHPSTGPYVEDLAKLVVRSFNDIENLMDEGNKARTVAATNMNQTSSRSHAVFTLTVTQKRHDTDTKMDAEKVSRISLVDLAGSERATSTGATGARLKEGAEINRSLSTLGRVIAALADLSAGKLPKKKGAKAASMVPYRDSVLTWLLKDCLGGNSMTAMIAAISPADINYEETLSTLRYADSAKRIRNHATVNEDPNARMIRELKEELEQLRSKLGGGAREAVGGGAAGGAGAAGGTAQPAEEYYPPDTPLEKQLVSIQQPDGQIKKVNKAEIVEQLDQSEKLYKDLNQTWEEKLQRTEEIAKERESALEDLGISIEKGFVGLTTPKKMPHLVNLSDDPLLAECLVYNLKPGKTILGNADTGSTAEIRLNGSKILAHHCSFENADNVVTIVPCEGASVVVNGQRIDQPKRLKSGSRIILGDFHIFRFNHPEEARAERVEQSSLLRHTVTTSQLGTPARAGHNRNYSKAGSEFDGDSSRADSPLPVKIRDSDWFLARREAASALLGQDQKIKNLTDDELDALFDDVQRARAVRKARVDAEEDSDSLSSYPVRDKYMSNGTIDNFSLDTAITMPSSPRRPEDDEGESDSDKKAPPVVKELLAEKARMEEELQALKKQHGTSEDQSATGYRPLDEGEKALVRPAAEHWKKMNYVRMAETVFQHASLLKEAQIMSQIMDKNILFQFVIVDVGYNIVSSYDLVLNGISGDDDIALEDAHKPCIGIRVSDYKRLSIHVWSIDKLQKRLQTMRKIHQYIDRPGYIQHFKLENPFSDHCAPQYSLVGDADIPLTAVFESRVQDFAVEATSPWTQSVIGIVRLSLEPSSAQAPSSTIKFNVVMRDLVGFAEREGTEVHAQLFVPGVSDESGATTTQMISDFDESPVRFESVHGMSLPLSSPRTSKLKVSIFARVTGMHMDKLTSWDEMRDAPEAPPQKRKKTRIPESEFYSEERHDIFARVHVLELTESGLYLPVEVTQQNPLDPGTYQLHQGLQRRVQINLTHSSSETLPWDDINSLRIGSIRLLDPWGKMPDLDQSSPDVPLKMIQEPTIKDNADGTSNVSLLAQWDSSLHNSLLLDRTTADKYRVQVTLRWNLVSSRLQDPIVFELDQRLQILGRAYIRPQSMFKQLWSTTRVVHSTVGMFSVAVRPVSAKRAADLWRMNTENDYIKGEEALASWAPRKVSLVQDFVTSRKQRQRSMEIEAARGALGSKLLTPFMPFSAPYSSSPARKQTMTAKREALLRRCLTLWTTSKNSKPPVENILIKDHTEPPPNGAAFAARAPASGPASVPGSSANSDITSITATSQSKPRCLACIQHIPKNPSISKSGYLYNPDDTYTRWIRRFVELRLPYLHICSVPEGDEINAINLSKSHVDHDPDFARLLDANDSGSMRRPNVFAIYGPENTFLFAAMSERVKIEWILKIDESYFSSTRR